MENSVSYSYEHEPVVRYLWSHFRAVPLLPLGVLPDLKVFTLLQRRKDGFYVVGNLADLCSPGEHQKALAWIIKSMAYVNTSKYGERKTRVINDVVYDVAVDGQAKRMLQLLSFSSGSSIWHKAHRVEIQSNEHTLTSTYLDRAERADLFKGFHLNTESLPQGSRASSITLYLVTDLIQVPSLTVTAWDKHGAALSGTGLVDGTAQTAQVAFDISEGNTVSSKSKQPFPVAFRGMVCHFKKGRLIDWKETEYQPDAAAAAVSQPQDPALEEALSSLKFGKHEKGVVYIEPRAKRLGHAYGAFLRPRSFVTSFVTAPFNIPIEEIQLEAQVDLGEIKMMIEETQLEGQVDLGEIKTRQDVCALGFASFEVPFQSGQVLCLFKFEALPVGDIVHIYFLHEEGMACLVGVGLTNSVVILRANSEDIYVEEVGEVDWKRMWTTEYNSTTSAPILFTKREPNSLGEGDPTSTHPTGDDEKEVSMEEARNPYSYEDGPHAMFTLKGASLSTLKGRSLLHGLTRRVVQSRLEAAANQECRRHPGETGCRGPAGQDSGVDNTVSTQPSMTTGDGNGLAQLQLQPPNNMSNGSDVKMTEGSSGKPELAQVTTDGRQGEEGTDKFLTVEVILNPQHNMIMDLETQAVTQNVWADNGVLDIQTTMTVSFFHRQQGNQSGKEMEVSLTMEYALDSIEQTDQNSSGWYHDHLRASFQCLDPSALAFIARGIGEETPFAEYRRDLVTTTKRSEAKSKNRNWSMGLSGGVPHATATGGYARSNNMATSTSESVEAASAVQDRVVDKSMFSIFDVSSGKVVRYHASVAEPLKLETKFWDENVRNQALHSRVLSTFVYSVWGRWELHETPEQPTYEVRVQRKLLLSSRSKLVEKPSKFPWTSKSPAKFPSKSRAEKLDTKKLLQRLTRKFRIGHSFDQTDYQRERYKWEMESILRCPVPTKILRDAQT